MQQDELEVKGVPNIAVLTNVSELNTVIAKALAAPQHLPKIIGFFGEAGRGKSFAAAFCAVKYEAVYVECKKLWSGRNVLSHILFEIAGSKPMGYASDMLDQVCEWLVANNRPLIIDQADYLIENRLIEVIRDIHDGSGNVPVVLIGEKNLQSSIKKWERLHSRVSWWLLAKKASMKDCRCLASLYAKGVTISEDMMEEIAWVSEGSVRRVSVNIELVARECKAAGAQEIALDDWDFKRNPLSGRAPRTKKEMA
ncbi:AAA family ATPase [Candidatus Electronema sp. JM]|uniref:AAA family ATPase n=1 Tax=Candidatus Electronema sp. JM TaxID=3401571 RepID=UPI003AA995BA